MKTESLKLDEVIGVQEVDGRIMIDPVRPRAYELAKLLACITPENVHPEIDFGSPVGGESTG